MNQGGLDKLYWPWDMRSLKGPGGGGSIHFQANSGAKSVADVGFSLISSEN